MYLETNKIISSLNDRYDFEFVITDNNSCDDSLKILRKIAEQDNRVKVYKFSKNYGYQKSIFEGYCKSKGDAVIQLDCDLQDPPNLIPEFIKIWENGYKVVYGVRKTRQENIFINQLRKLFYRVINILSEDDLPIDAGDFRLVDRDIVELLKLRSDTKPYIRGAIASFGYKQYGYSYDRNRRIYGESKFNFYKLISLAVDGILNHSIIPLRFASFFGIFITIIFLSLSFVYFILKYFNIVEWPSGFTTLTVLNLFGIGINALFLGVIGEYIGRIYIQLKNNYPIIIEESIND